MERRLTAAGIIVAGIVSAAVVVGLLAVFSPVLLVCELVWIIVCYALRYPHVTKSLSPTPVTDIKGDLLWRRIMRLADVTSLDTFVSGWFHDAPFHMIRRGNMEDFIDYGFYYKRFPELDPKEREATFRRVSEVERKFGIRFPPGYNKKVRFMAQAHEPLRYFHKPLLVHLSGEFLRVLTFCALYSMGFSTGVHQGFRYWVRYPGTGGEKLVWRLLVWGQGFLYWVWRGIWSKNTEQTQQAPPVQDQSATKSARLRVWDSVSELEVDQVLDNSDTSPVVFLHGVGLGYAPYLQLVAELMEALPNRPFMLIEKPHVCLGMTMRAVSTDRVADAIASIMEMQGWPSAAFVAHSYGTFVASRVIQLHRSRVQSVVLMDPVCMFTILPDLVRNFVYASPNVNKMLRSPFSFMVEFGRWVLSRDLVVAESFCRQFIWHKETLWGEDLSEEALIVLGAEDHLVPARLVQRAMQLSKCAARIVYHPTHGHGEFLIDSAWRAQLVSQIKDLVNSCSKRSGMLAKA